MGGIHPPGHSHLLPYLPIGVLRIGHHACVAESNESERPRALIGIVRNGNEPIPDSEIDHVLRWICEHGGQHEPPATSLTKRSID